MMRFVRLSMRHIYIYIYVYIHTYVYIYVYIYLHDAFCHKTRYYLFYRALLQKRPIILRSLLCGCR